MRLGYEVRAEFAAAAAAATKSSVDSRARAAYPAAHGGSRRRVSVHPVRQARCVRARRGRAPCPHAPGCRVCAGWPSSWRSCSPRRWSSSRRRPPRRRRRSACDARVNDNLKKLLECVTLEGVREHQAALQAIADANNGTRVSGLAGLRRVGRLRRRRSSPPRATTSRSSRSSSRRSSSLSPLDPRAGRAGARSARSRTASCPTPAAATSRRAVSTVDRHPRLQRRGLRRVPGRQHRAHQPRRLHLRDQGDERLQRRRVGRGHLQQRRRRPQRHARQRLHARHRASPRSPRPSASSWRPRRASCMRLKTDTFRGIATTYNVLAESKGGDPNNVVMVGRPPRLRQRRPGHQRQRLRHRGDPRDRRADGQASSRATRSASPSGAPRSRASSARRTTSTTSPADGPGQDHPLPQLRHDRLAEPRLLRLRRRRLRRGRRRPGPGGLGAIEKTFEAFYTSRGLPFKGTDFSGRSDYGPFIAAGIPSGGLFTGAEGIKTAEEAALWGGTAGVSRTTPATTRPATPTPTTTTRRST